MKHLLPLLLFASIAFFGNPVSAQSVKVFGDWPDTGFCDVSFSASGAWQGFTGPNAQCNDKTSAVQVPFGMSATLCDNDEAGGLSPCRHFLPGTYGLDDKFNDKTSVVKAENVMIGYLNSADFPTDWAFGINFSGDPSATPPAGFNLSISAGVGSSSSFGFSDSFVAQGYVVTVPASCVQPDFHVTSQAGVAHWSAYWSPGQPLIVKLWVRNRKLGGANNWIGVQLECVPTDNGKRSWGS